MATQLTERAPLIAVPDDEDCGPAMRACTHAERAYILALIETGAKNRTKAALIAGVGGSDNAAAVWACRAMQKPRVLAALREEADKAMRGDVYLARAALAEIASDSMHKDRFKASVELLNRAGLLVETTHRVIVEDSRDSKEIMREIVAIARKNNIDPRTLLGNDIPSDVLEGEFVEVKQPAMSSAGLEDLLA